MRMIGIGLMGFLLAGVALLLSTMNILEKGQRYVSELTQGPQLIFEERTAVPASDRNVATVYRSNPNYPVILSGLPAYQSVAFHMPMDARPTSGYLQIDATLQVLEGVEGVLRISIDNARRGEMLLRPGEVGRSLQIPLSPTDFAKDQLVVSFSLQGEGPHSRCSKDEGYEAIVEIETTSAVFLTLDRALDTPRDRVNAWGQLVRVAWPSWLKPEERLRRMVLATQFQHHGMETLFIDDHSADALTTNDLRSALPEYNQQNAGNVDASWPRRLAIKGANAGLRRFHGATSWRERYDLRNDATMRLPSQLDLHLTLGHRLGGDPWSLTVTLNNRLIHQVLLDASQSRFVGQIALPKDMQTAMNVLEVVVSSSRTGAGECDPGPELIAEMLPATKLSAGDHAFSDTLSELRIALTNMGPLRVSTLSALTAADAKAATDMMAEIIPGKVVLKPDMSSAQIIIVSPRDPAFSLPDSEPIWRVTLDAETHELMARALEGGSEFSRAGLAILVIPNGFDLGEMAS